ncbi:MAG: hypothetical protein K2N63_06600 [Lachnospiraceae bacterium]|nr:hypothetical protein [Lachnospiraceae bacterium]
MKAKLIFSIALTVLMFVTGCTPLRDSQSANSSSDSTLDPSPTVISEFRLSHGISSLDILTEHITYDGQPIHLEYEFENGNVSSNLGLILFLNGYIQPFSIDNSEDYSVINIIDLEPDSSKTITINFDPIVGTAGDTIPLHIAAIFDAKSTISNPTIAASFFQTLSQAFPVSVVLNEECNTISYESFYVSSFFVKSENNQVLVRNNTEENQKAEFLFTDFSSTTEVEGNHISFNQSSIIELINDSDHEKEYHIFAFVDNEPILWNQAPFLSVNIPARNKFSTSIILDTNLAEEDRKEYRQLFLVAVPIHDAGIQRDTMVLKTKTIALYE